ncbi:MAG: peptidase E [Acidimicrobiaceae bacterium]|nr:peptidase E [Acidimicrobiaceae bacterium]
MILEALALTRTTRPRICLLETAGGDDSSIYALLYEAFNLAGCDVRQLRVFPQPSADPEETLLNSDFVWVGGGSVANLLALWRLHGIDTAMRAAWEKGVILGGVSAGSLCWHVGGTTDSFGPTLQPVINGLALLPYANGVHYDSEAQRRPLLHRLVADGTLPEVAYATDDHVGIWYEGIEATRVVGDLNYAAFIGPAAYLVTREGGGVVERRVGVGESF